MQNTILVFLIVLIIGVGVVAGIGAIAVEMNGGPQPSDYVIVNGECWVHPQGDPLYDEHYAKNVNLPNCEAYELQEQAQNIEAITGETEWQTTQSKIATWGFALVACFIVGFIIIVALVK